MIAYRSVVLALLHAAALLLAPAEHAITWDAPAECPDAAYVQARLAEQLRGVDVETTEVRARVTAPTGPGDRWRMRIAIGNEGQRDLEGETCVALADAAAVMIAISLDAAREHDPGLPSPPPVAAPAGTIEPLADPAPAQPDAPPITAALSRPRAADPAAPRRRAWGSPRAVLGVMTGVHGVGLPAIGAGIGGRLGIRWGPIQAAVVGTHWIERERSVVGDIAASYQLGTGGLELCGVLALGRARPRLELLACADAEAGILRAQGQRAAPSRTLRDPWVALGGGVGALWTPRSWIATGVRLDVVAPLFDRRFVIGDVSAGSVGPADVRGTLVLEFRLPASEPAR